MRRSSCSCSSRLFALAAVRLCFAGALLLLTVLPASARDFEVSAFAAVRDGGLSFSTNVACITLVGVECPNYGSLEDSSRDAWGIGAALQLTGPWWLDLRWSQEEEDIFFYEDQALTDPAPGRIPMDISHLHGGMLYRFREDAGWSPFVTAFGGLVRIESDISTSARMPIDIDRFSAGLGAGVLVDLGSRIGLRFEARGIWTDLPDEFFEDQLSQLEGSAALRYRF